YKDFLRDLLLFYTSEDTQRTLKEYAENMPESQKFIYYAHSDSVKHAMCLPQCDQVRAHGRRRGPSRHLRNRPHPLGNPRGAHGGQCTPPRLQRWQIRRGA
ncbi:MAG: hypothetical protein IKD70_05335, partial [Eggerthellaceae bacterium]|nr:hypothetical protein [Eggerthellaceae bacterium]